MATLDRIWLKQYEKGVPETIGPLVYSSVGDYIHECCERFSESSALSNFGVQLSYREYDDLGSAFAGYLQQKLGLSPGERLAVMMPNILQYPVVVLGALRAGLVVVNFNPFYSARELKDQLNDSGATVIVMFAGCAHKLEEVLEQTPVRHVVVTNIGDLFPWPRSVLMNAMVRYAKRSIPAWNIPAAISLRSALDPRFRFDPVSISAEDLAFLQYTGGTTGTAKGAMLSHGNLLSNIEQTRVWLRQTLDGYSQRVIVALPLYHIFALTQNFLSLLQFGGVHYLVTDPRDTHALVALIKESRCTVMAGVNALFLKIMECPEFESADFGALQFVVGGGAAMQTTIAEKWQKITGVPVCQAYGLTEASPGVTCNPLPLNRFTGSVGVPVSSTLIRLCGESGEPADPGELLVKGPQVMQGYWNNESESLNVFDDDGWLRTGDIATQDEQGFLRIVDRKKDVIIVSGFKVFPNEIEEALIAHPDIVDVGVVGEPHPVSGECVKAFLVTRNPQLSVASVQSFCRSRMIAYKVPDSVVYVAEIPKSKVGKVLRRKLRQQSSE